MSIVFFLDTGCLFLKSAGKNSDTDPKTRTYFHFLRRDRFLYPLPDWYNSFESSWKLQNIRETGSAWPFPVSFFLFLRVLHRSHLCSVVGIKLQNDSMRLELTRAHKKKIANNFFLLNHLLYIYIYIYGEMVDFGEYDNISLFFTKINQHLSCKISDELWYTWWHLTLTINPDGQC